MNRPSSLRYTSYVANPPALRPPASEHETVAAPSNDTLSPRIKLLNWSGIFFALLQSACTAVVAISGIRVAIGLSALAAAAGIHAPAKGFHQDAIRIPMMLFALAGALVNLFVVWRVRTLRKNPASRWRQKPVTASKLRAETFQIALSVLTLVLLAAEWITHPMVHLTH